VVGGFNPSEKKIWKSVGMIIPNIWKNVPNHQPDIIHIYIYMFLQGIKTMNRIWYREQSHVDIPVMSLGMGGGK
jgi:hypothetical protein